MGRKRQIVLVHGEEMDLSQAAVAVGISRQAISRRLREGRPIDVPRKWAGGRSGPRTCKRCGGKGHFAKTCTTPLQEGT